MSFSQLDLVFRFISNYNICRQAKRKAFRIPQRKVATMTVIKLKADGEFYRQLIPFEKQVL